MIGIDDGNFLNQLPKKVEEQKESGLTILNGGPWNGQKVVVWIEVTRVRIHWRNRALPTVAVGMLKLLIDRKSS